MFFSADSTGVSFVFIFMFLIGGLVFVLSTAIFVFNFAYALSPRFRAWTDKIKVKRHKRYMNALGEDGYEDLQDMKEDQAAINDKAIETNAKAFSEGWHSGDDDDEDVEMTRCPYCGEIIEKDSKFCKNCGKELDAEETGLWSGIHFGD